MESEALTTFFTHVAGFTTLPVYWPNVSVPDSPADEHYRVTVFPVPPDNVDVCGGSIHAWLLQVAVYVRDGVGVIKPAEYAELIRTALPFNTRLTSTNFTFQTTDPCSVFSPIRRDGWFITPVQCRFITID